MDAAPHVVEDFGNDPPRIISRTLAVKVLDREFKCSNEIECFRDSGAFVWDPNRRYIMLKLLLGDRMLVSIAEVLEGTYLLFDVIFSSADLCQEFKLIVNPPANVRIPWKVTGPKDSSSISEFFGPQNCSVKRTENHVAVITFDVYARFMIRSFLPKLAFQPGRISDYILVDYGRRVVVTGFRIVATPVLTDLLLNKGANKHDRFSYTSASYM